MALILWRFVAEFSHKTSFNFVSYNFISCFYIMYSVCKKNTKLWLYIQGPLVLSFIFICCNFDFESKF